MRFILVFFVSFISFGASWAGAEPVTTLGLSACLTGPGAAWGSDVKNVLKFANQKLAGGRYKFIVEDDKCDPKTAATIAEKFSVIDKLKYVFTVCAAATFAEAPRYAQNGVLVMAPLVTPSRISGIGIFRTGLSDAMAAQRLAEYAFQRYKQVAILTEQNEYSVGFLKDFVKSAVELGVKTDNEDFELTSQDVRAQLLRLKAKAPQALFINTNSERPFATILKQVKQLQMKLPILAAYMPGSTTLLELAGDLANGIVFVDFPSSEDLLSPEGQKLYTEYLQEYGPLQSWTYSFPATFESFRAVHMAISSGQPPKEYLEQTVFNGIIGSYRFNKLGDLVGPRHVLRVIRNGQSTPLAEN